MSCLGSGPATLCGRCKQLIEDADHLLDQHETNFLVSEHFGQHFMPLEQLRTSQTQCSICAFVFYHYINDDDDLELGDSTDRLSKYIGVELLLLTEPSPTVELHFKICRPYGSFATLTVQPTDHPLGGRRPDSNSTRSRQTFDTAKQWLRDCEQHALCKSWAETAHVAQFESMRLLDVGTSASPDVRLLCDDSLPDKNIRYAALSHCWGRAVSFRLLQQSLADFQRAIAWDALLPTFQDAIVTCRELGIRYLWIDALCIVQDSDEDWLLQGSAMDGIYSGAYLSLCATSSASGAGGLFRARDPVSMASFTAKCPSSGLSYLCYNNTFGRIEHEPLSERAWVVQERALAPRKIHFANDQIHWECVSLRTSENLPPGVQLSLTNWGDDFMQTAVHAMVDNAQSTSDIQRAVLELWDLYLNRYTESDLTFAKDKAIAIHGLAQSICRCLGVDAADAYINGIWKFRFLDGLLWSSAEVERGSPRLFEQQGSCSWSWLGTDGYVCSQYYPRGELPEVRDYQQVVAELLDVGGSCTLAHPDPIARGWARLRAPLCRVLLCRSSESYMSPDDDEAALQKDRTLLVGNTLLKERQHFLLDLDDYDTTPFLEGEDIDLYFLLIRCFGRDSSGLPTALITTPRHGRGRYEGLLLRPSEHGEPGALERIGYVIFTPFGMGYDRPWSSTPLLVNDMLHACSSLDRQFLRDDIPVSSYESVDEEHMYTFKLV